MTKVRKAKIKDIDGNIIKEIQYTTQDLETLKSNPETLIPTGIKKLIEVNKKLKGKFLKLYPNVKITLLKKTYKNLKLYNSHIEVLNALNHYGNQPKLTNLKKLNKVTTKLEKELKQAENNYFYTDLKKENSVLNSEYEQLEKVFKEDRGLVELAKHIVKNGKIPNKKPLVKLSLSPNFVDFNWQTETIYNKTQPLFISTLDQWQNLFSNDIQVFKKPIELTPDTTLIDLYFLIFQLYQNRLILKKNFHKVLQDVKAFSYCGKIVDQKQFSNASQSLKTSTPRNIKQIEYILNKLKIK